MLETKVNTVKGAKVSNPLNDLVKDSVKEVIKTPEQIKLGKEKLQTSEYNMIEKELIIKLIENEKK